ncbi:TIGR01777 family protein [Bacillus clarus]|uniref:NAD dependent epimerase/dehydratase family protein n=1 Tax=Bacillus clarus TaxID=2338372 RepID=A0A090YWV3_9BACI|nr:TIGR01777 family oxidoreductase [Bacillus clarus]KFN02827.1 NAD dependent epimerase/dehydratase family protein [Bacillus clarus]RFT65858.1 TIGR01777 family protein [Bacillus clarus]
MKIAISGGTGFIGKRLANFLSQKGNTVYILTRKKIADPQNSNIQYVQWSVDLHTFPLSSIDVVINLAGESINNGRWTQKQKEAILNSRIKTTKGLIKQLQKLQTKPHTFINASAIGYYGTSETKIFTEQQEDPGDDFLAQTVYLWEKEATQARHLGIRTIYIRFGVVLGANGGALPKMLLPYRLYVGGTIGSGNQWLSWIHLDDAVRMIDFAIHKEEIEGALNITAPTPIKMKEFGATLSNITGRPHWLPVPSFVLHALLGEMSMLVLEGQHVLPNKAIEHGYQYSFPTLNHALQNILSHTM